MNYQDMEHAKQVKSFSDRLNKACDNAGIPVRGRAGYLREKLPFSISLVAIRKWLVGESIPDTKKLSSISDIVGSSVEELLGNVTSSEAEKDNLGSYTIIPNTVLLKNVPILSQVQAGAWSTTLTPDLLGDDVEWQATSTKVSDEAFAMKVVGNSMTNPFGAPSIPHGSVVIVEPCSSPITGSIVVATLNDAPEATIKKLEIDGPQKFLVPLNPKYDPIPINGNCRIVGFVKQIIMDIA